jgi:hypothetical protein
MYRYFFSDYILFLVILFFLYFLVIDCYLLFDVV